MGKRVWQLILALGLLLLLSGCMSQSGEDFYALPQLPEDYLSLQQTINTVMNDLGAEYAAPSAGSNTQNIQLQDLDGDGVQESALAFFRVASAEKPLKIYVFRQNEATGEYETAWIIEGVGTAIYSIAFENLGGTGEKEIVVSWQISAKTQSLAAYALQRDGDVVELMRSGYTRSAVLDLDRDNEKEIVLLQLDTAENNSRAELYKYDNGLMVHTSAVSLSSGITDIQATKVGALTNLMPALFVSSDFGENGGRITDIITLRDGALTNLTQDEASGMSLSTIRYYTDFKDVNGTDINNDGILELPMPELLPAVGENATPMYLLHWIQCTPDGEAATVYTTFHCYDDGWYLILPEEWQGRVTIARRESSGSVAGSERAVAFYNLPQEHAGAEAADEAAEPVEFLTIYRLTGSNRTHRASIDERFKLFESSDVIYAARFRSGQWDCGLDQDGLQERFCRIKVDWSAEN